jgi:hypothetical protein
LFDSGKIYKHNSLAKIMQTNHSYEDEDRAEVLDMSPSRLRWAQSAVVALIGMVLLCIPHNQGDREGYERGVRESRPDIIYETDVNKDGFKDVVVEGPGGNSKVVFYRGPNGNLQPTPEGDARFESYRTGSQ